MEGMVLGITADSTIGFVGIAAAIGLIYVAIRYKQSMVSKRRDALKAFAKENGLELSLKGEDGAYGEFLGISFRTTQESAYGDYRGRKIRVGYFQDYRIKRYVNTYFYAAVNSPRPGPLPKAAQEKARRFNERYGFKKVALEKGDVRAVKEAYALDAKELRGIADGLVEIAEAVDKY